MSQNVNYKVYIPANPLPTVTGELVKSDLRADPRPLRTHRSVLETLKACTRTSTSPVPAPKKKYNPIIRLCELSHSTLEI